MVCVLKLFLECVRDTLCNDLVRAGMPREHGSVPAQVRACQSRRLANEY